MMDTRKRIVLCSLVGALLTLSSTLPSTGLAESQKEKSISFTGEQIRFYEKEVVPLLKENCYKCHAGSKIRGGLRLDNRAAILKGGDLGPAVVMDKIESSPFLKAIHHRDNLEMPPDGKLSAEKIAVLE
ncbi:MAG: c-type cytochrome domain-containing protein, partial [Gemmataceae bacterium]